MNELTVQDTSPEDSAVQGGLFSSFHYSRKANASATAAAAEAVNAAIAKDQAAQAAADARADADRLEASMDEVESAFALLEPGVWNSCLCALKRANAAVIGETSKMRVLRRIYEV